MAKATATKMARRFSEHVTHRFKGGRIEEVLNYIRKVVSRPARQRRAQACQHCHEPMMVADGQVAYFHAECRKDRRSRRNQLRDVK